MNKLFKLFATILMLNLLSGVAIAMNCPDGAEFWSKTNSKAHFTVLNIGTVDFPLGSTNDDVKWVKGFAIKVKLPNGHIAYAHGSVASYTFLTNLEWLMEHNLNWYEFVFQYHEGQFYRIMEDDGKTAYYTVEFKECR